MEIMTLLRRLIQATAVLFFLTWATELAGFSVAGRIVAPRPHAGPVSGPPSGSVKIE